MRGPGLDLGCSAAEIKKNRANNIRSKIFDTPVTARTSKTGGNTFPWSEKIWGLEILTHNFPLPLRLLWALNTHLSTAISKHLQMFSVNTRSLWLTELSCNFVARI